VTTHELLLIFAKDLSAINTIMIQSLRPVVYMFDCSLTRYLQQFNQYY